LILACPDNRVGLHRLVVKSPEFEHTRVFNFALQQLLSDG
jgi:hypothetical protein